VGPLLVEWHNFRCDLINSWILFQDKPDALIWTGGDQTGIISVKNVYLVVEKLKWIHTTRIWRKALWSWDCPLKIKIFIWLEVENIILSWDVLQRRGFIGPSYCIFCKKDREKTHHLLVDCEFTSTVWGKLLLHNTSLGTCSGNTLVDCLNSWYKQNVLHSTLSTYTSWFIWQEMNIMIFENQHPTIQRVVYQVIAAMKDHIEKPMNVVRKLGRTCHSMGGLTGWFDGAVMSSSQNNGVGGIIKLNEQCSYKWLLNCGQGKNTREKLLGSWALLTLASQLSILTIHVHGDSKVIIDWLRGKGRLQVVTLDYWKHRLRGLIDLFHSISFAHVYREYNEVVDNLSKQALLKEPGKIYYYECVEDHQGPQLSLDLY
jgi:hypothetical protein